MKGATHRFGATCDVECMGRGFKDKQNVDLGYVIISRVHDTLSLANVHFATIYPEIVPVRFFVRDAHIELQ